MMKDGIEDMRGKTVLKNLFKTDSDSENESSVDEKEDEEETRMINMSEPSLSPPSSSSTFTSSTSGITVSVYEEKHRGIAFQLWPAARLLCNYIDEHKDEQDISSHTSSNGVIIELGAGIGLCGLYLSACGAGHVIITDLKEAMDIMEKNISLNIDQSTDARAERIVEAKELKWGFRQDIEEIFASLTYGTNSPPLIIASDCVYWECLFTPFFETLRILVEEYNCTVLISHVKRWKKDEKFFNMCRKKMNVDIVKEDVCYIKEENSLSGKERRQVSRIYKISKNS